MVMDCRMMISRRHRWLRAFALVAILSPAITFASTQANGADCPRGTPQTDNGCLTVQIPENAELNIYGSGWTCQRGYYNAGGRCLAVQIPENAELNIYGSGWTCKHGYYNAGG